MTLTVTAVAARLGKHETTILRWLALGRFPHATKTRGRWLIPLEDVEQMMQSPPLTIALTDVLDRLDILEMVQLELLVYHQIQTPLKAADIRRFLERHHKLPNTVRGWPDVPTTSFTDALLYVRQKERENPPKEREHALAECSITLCVCHRLLHE